MSESNRVAVRYCPEVTYGVTPTNATTWQDLRFTAESFTAGPQTTTSAEIRSDRMFSDMPKVGLSVTGNIDIELSANSYDEFIEAAMCGTWAALSGQAAAIKINLSSLVNTGAAVAQSSFGLAVDGGAAADVIIAVSASEYADNTAMLAAVSPAPSGYTFVADNGGAATDGLFTLTSSTLGDSSQLVLSAGGTGVDLALTGSDFGSDAVVGANAVKIGTINRSFSVEKEFADITKFASFTGMRVGSMSLSLAYGAIVSGSFGFGGNGAAQGGATIVGTNPSAAATVTPVMNASSDIGSIKIDGVATTICINSMTFDLENGLRPIECVGSDAPTDQLKGTSNLTGSLEMYLDAASFALYGKALSNTSFALEYTVTAGSKSYNIFIPNAKLTGDTPSSAGLDQDVMFSSTYTALFDTDEGSSAVITRVQ